MSESDEDRFLDEITEAGGTLNYAHTAPAELVERAEINRYMDSVINDKPLQGAERELLEEINVEAQWNGMRAIPLAILGKGLENRADTATDTIAGDFETNLDNTVLPVFAETDLAFLGISPQMVEPGARRIPVIRDTNKATPVAKLGTVDAAAATIVTREFNPKEIRKRFTFALAEHFNWGAQIETDLTEVLRGALMERLDDMAIAGTGTPPQPTGLFNQFIGTGLPSNPATATTWADYISALAGAVDGRYCNDESDMRLLVGSATWAHMRSQYRGSDSPVDAISALRNMGADVRASGRVAAAASTRQDAILATSTANARRGFWVGAWAAFYLVRDPFTASADAKVNLTATMFYDCGGVAIPDDASTNSDIEGMKRLRFQVG